MFLTQSEFAKELGVSIASVARWETGENEPTMKIKRRLNDLFIKYKLVEEWLWQRQKIFIRQFIQEN